MLISLGIDQGVANCGYAIVQIDNDEEIKVIDSGCIRTNSKDTLGKRLLKLHSFIEKLITKYNPQMIGCERMFFNGTQKTGRNKSASMMYTNMATAILHIVSTQANIQFFDYPPTTVKKIITGYGRANKEEVIEKVKDITKIDIKTEHQADAIAIGITTLIKYKEERGD
jgi:crossover junction endodeoxyribonuclease RuvC